MGVSRLDEGPVLEQVLICAKTNMFLNLHLNLYSRKISDLSFKDNSWKSINESECNITDNVDLKRSIEEKEFCLQGRLDKTANAIDCSSRKDVLKGFICVAVVKRSLESWWHQPTFQLVSQITRVSTCVGDRLCPSDTALICKPCRLTLSNQQWLIAHWFILCYSN